MLAFIRSLGGSAGALRGGSIIGAGSVGCGNGLVPNDCTEVILVSFIGFLGLNSNSSSSEPRGLKSSSRRKLQFHVIV